VPDGIYHEVARRFWFVYFEKAESQWATAGSCGVFVDDSSGAVAQSTVGRSDLTQRSVAVRSLTALFCLVLLASALTGAVHDIL
jgi:hypothetical protein